MRNPYCVGLTGGIGSGKSAAAAFFAEQGIAIVDADIVAREVVMPGEPALKAIIDHFGEAILTAEQTLNRRKLREIIFQDSTQKAWLEALLHPAIRQRIIEQLACAHSAYSLLVSPLLLETNQHTLTDRVIVIDCPEALQVERAQARDNASATQVKTIMASQMSRPERLKQADDILHNHGDLADLHTQVLRLHNQYLALTP
ncbi:dephospho-CoA kinase [Gilvimarinus agarilyticus]|uniref:dephospho-CoA kinase n=1 Tax=Gilvimarinus sp. 2_MG-2023 TaxID=3062666 RepID=UPI001C0816E8|nr:dephospho-CoA kinase [Gilvimarinus sp. 2_MG-2023]MBU2885414.1 dephospho-CoA kinase [Gilvimarinus agarilyticus]MDO6570313.1 dephospho-CoA kinase [Gilvimarinus sp. 2_MG-2023]